MGEYRVDELARAAGTTVRNVRAYQDRGLLSPPRRVGRIALYSEDHLARLRLVGALLERGYTLANIGELVALWERGQDLGALLGLEVVGEAGSSEAPPPTAGADDLGGLLGGVPIDEAVLTGLVDAGLVAPVGPGRYRLLNPRALEVGALLVGTGVPLDAVLAAARRLRADVDDVASQFVGLVEVHVLAPLGEPLPVAEVPRLTELVARLRSLATEVVEVELTRAVERHVRARLEGHLGRHTGREGAAGAS